MKIVRFASTPDGGSQFIEVNLPVDNASTDAWSNTSRRSATLPAQSAMVTEMPEGLYQDWHPASRRQLLVVLSGTLEIETSDGKSTGAAAGKSFSPTMSAAAAIEAARSAARPVYCSCICRLKPISADNRDLCRLR
jgi:quercetin dioxygenase-like cupin family protein